MPDMFKMDHAAFRPFWSDRLAYSAKRGSRVHSGSVAGCLFELGTDEPLDADVSTHSTRRAWNFTIPFRAWPLDTPPQTGDSFELCACGTLVKATAEKVASSISGEWTVTIREVA